jgi:hypothetical protein
MQTTLLTSQVTGHPFLVSALLLPPLPLLTLLLFLFFLFFLLLLFLLSSSS